MDKLYTKRLLIRPMQETDIFHVHEILKDKETMKFFIEGPYSLNKVKEIVNRNHKEFRHFVVCLRSSNRVIGKISYHDWEQPKSKEIGWIFNPNTTGRGYCTEAANAIKEYAFTSSDINKIVAVTQPDNVASVKVCEKMGMHIEKTKIKSIHFKDDIYWDEIFYSIIKPII